MSNFRFGIRDLLWAMVVVGLAIGWWQAELRLLDLSKTDDLDRHRRPTSGVVEIYKPSNT